MKTDQPLSEAEARAALTAMWATNNLARRIIGGWIQRDKKPTKDEMMNLLRHLAIVEEEVLHARESHDVSGLDTIIARCERLTS